MSPVDRVLIATDLEPTSEAALDAGLQVAASLDSDVVVVHVQYEPPAYVGAPYTCGGTTVAERRRLIRASIRHDLEEIAAQAEAEAIDADTDVRTSRDVADMLCRLAGEHEPDLLVMGHRSLSWLERLVREPSVAERVAHQAPCPVLVVAEDRVRRGPSRGRWLIHADLSPTSEKAMAVCAPLARALGASITLFHAYAPPGIRPPSELGAPPELLHYPHVAQERLEHLRRVFFDDIEDVTCELEAATFPHRAVIDRASARDVDTVVAPVFEAEAPASWFADDADLLIRKADCTALVVPEASWRTDA